MISSMARFDNFSFISKIYLSSLPVNSSILLANFSSFNCSKILSILESNLNDIFCFFSIFLVIDAIWSLYAWTRSDLDRDFKSLVYSASISETLVTIFVKAAWALETALRLLLVSVWMLLVRSSSAFYKLSFKSTFLAERSLISSLMLWSYSLVSCKLFWSASTFGAFSDLAGSKSVSFLSISISRIFLDA